jgi:hypothetical protein
MGYRKLLIALFVPCAAVCQEAQEEESYGPPVLFDSHELLTLTIEADFDEIKDDRHEDSEYRDGTITIHEADGSTTQLPLKVKTRGKFRLKKSTCEFPPLRLNFPKGGVEGTVFQGQDKLKLVAHCRGNERYEQNLLEEYLVYRGYNLVTDVSFQVRLAHITYVDSSGKDDPITRYAFLLEEDQAVADRIGGALIEVPQANPQQYSHQEATVMSLYEYMMGNTDWSMAYFHNVKLVRTAENKYVPVPYDFDWAGFVNPPYASPDPSLDIRDVTERLYRGFCRPVQDWQAAYEVMRGIRAAFEEEIRTLPGYDPDRAEDSLEYIAEFYETINDEGSARRRIERACRQTT